METELKEVLRLLLRKSWWIVLTAAMFCGAVLFYQERYAVPQYEAVTQLIVHTVPVQTFTDTYKEMILTPAIMVPTVMRHPEWGLTAEALAERVKVANSEKSQIIRLAVRDKSSDLAAAIVHAVARTAQEEIPRIVNVDSVSILTGDSTGERPRDVSLSLSGMLAVAVALSVMVSVGFILLRAYFDDKIRTEEDIVQTLGKPVLASVLRIRKRDCAAINGSNAPWTDADASIKGKAGEGIRVGRNQEA